MVEALAKVKEAWLKQLLARGLLTEAQLAATHAKAKTSHADLADLLVQEGTLSEEQIAQLKAEAAGMVYVEVLDYVVEPGVLQLVPEAVARKHEVLPLYRIGNALTVAMEDPWNAVAIDELRRVAKVPLIHVVVASKGALRKAIERHYGMQIVEHAAQQILSQPTDEGAPTVEGVSDVSIIKLVDALFSEALGARASDIHLEPSEDRRTRVRFRIDGVLHEIKCLPLEFHEAVCSRVKILAKLDIAEHRKPQDGNLTATIDGREIDLRISTFPTVAGENLVVRLLDPSQLNLKLTELGLAEDLRERFEQLLMQPNGMVLVTGPTGSGKTTTLYAALSKINSMSKNIVTIEDPVEYHLPLIRQTQVNPKAGVTFATGLRSLLRQDPDVMMVGEIRDQETAEVAIHAALTGHLLLSTLHTNDAIGAVARLLDMGIEPYLLSSTLLGIVAQRLVRRICAHCQEGSRPPQELRKQYPDLKVLHRGRGCRFCRKTGFLGRLGVFELVVVDEELKALISAKRPTEELKQLARRKGMRSMREDGMLKVREGLTTLEELVRVVPTDTLA